MSVVNPESAGQSPAQPSTQRPSALNLDLDLQAELRPSAQQKQRLQDFLTELLAISRRYNMLIADDTASGTVVVDVESETIVGVNFAHAVDESNDNRVVMYTCDSSILDGVWVVESTDGSWTQQRYSPHDWGEQPAG